MLAGALLLAYSGLWLAVILAEKPEVPRGTGASKRQRDHKTT